MSWPRFLLASLSLSLSVLFTAATQDSVDKIQSLLAEARRSLSEFSTNVARSRGLDALDELEVQGAKIPAPSRSLLLGELADLFERVGDVKLFHRVQSTRVGILREIGPDTERLAAEVVQARAERKVGELFEAQVRLEEALAEILRREEAGTELEWRARHELGRVLLRKGRPLGAREELERVLVARRGAWPANAPILVYTELDLAEARRACGDVEGARLLLEEVVAVVELEEIREMPTRDLEPAARARIGLAEVRDTTGDLTGSLGDLQRAFALQQRLGSSSLEAKKIRTSRVLLEGRIESLNALLDVSAPPGSASDKGLSSGLTDQLGRFMTGLDTLSKRAPVRGFLAGGVLRAAGVSERSSAGIAGGLSAVDLLGKGWSAKDKARAAKERESPPEFDSRAIDGLRRAVRDLRKDLEIDLALGSSGGSPEAESIPDPIKLSQAVLIGRCQLGLGEFAVAQELLERVLGHQERFLADKDTRLHDTRMALAWAFHGLGRLDEARSLLQAIVRACHARARGLRLASRREYRERARVEMWRVAEALSLNDGLGKPEVLEVQIFELFETLRAASVGRPGAVWDRLEGTELEAVRDTWIEKQVALQEHALLRDTAKDPRAWEHAWRERVEDLDRFEGDLEARLREAGIPGFDLRLGQLREALRDKELLVSFWCYPRFNYQGYQEHLAAFLVTRKAFERVDLGRVEELRVDVEAWRRSLGAPLAPRGEVTALSAEAEGDVPQLLSKRLMEVLQSYLEQVKSLRFCLDDFLFLAPLEALPIGADLILAERIPVHFEVSLERLARGSKALASTGFIACGGIDYDQLDAAPTAHASAMTAVLDRGRPSSTRATFPLLSGARSEVGTLVAIYEEIRGESAELLGGADVDANQLREALVGRRFVHIATHGWFAPRGTPSQDDASARKEWTAGPDADTLHGYAPGVLCGLALSGANLGVNESGLVPGILTASELSTFDLSDCELAVLSACESGLGAMRPGQGVRSLQGALHAAGARSTLTSLWRVDDEWTAKLMVEFYRRLWSGVGSKAEALWEAKMTMRAAGAEERDWSGWVLVGDDA